VPSKSFSTMIRELQDGSAALDADRDQSGARQQPCMSTGELRRAPNIWRVIVIVEPGADVGERVLAVLMQVHDDGQAQRLVKDLREVRALMHGGCSQ
jgi:hypothetical protein